MDNLAHGLFGAALAETGLKRWTPLATPTLVIAANLPDADAFAVLGGEDFGLWARRGLTHGVLALALWPFVLTGLVVLWDRWIRRRRVPSLPPVRVRPLLVLSAIGVVSHPLLDWLNTYGVRFLMPFDGRWFYGDALFIVDPWMWLLAGSPVVLVHSRRWASRLAWLVVGAVATALVFLVEVVPIPVGVKLGWVAGVAALVNVRTLCGAQAELPRWARLVVAVVVAYAGAMWLGSTVAERQAAGWLRAQGIAFERAHGAPVAGNPFVRDVIVEAPGEYRFVWVDWLSAQPVGEGHPPMPRGTSSPVVAAALARPEWKGLANWLRFPSFAVEEESDGWNVSVDDVRYSRSGNGLGSRTVHVSRAEVAALPAAPPGR